MLEPASISKLITATAAYRADLDPDVAISHMRCNGALRLEGDYLWCPSPAGKLRGLKEAMAASCNVAFANLGLMVGGERLVQELRRYGFDQREEHGIFFGNILREPVRAKQLADLSIGLEYTQSTPLHAALIAAVFANGGYYLEPMLFSVRDGLLGISDQSKIEPRQTKILKDDWIEPLRESMHAVVQWGGTAHGIEPRDLTVAMKTGTAATPGRGYHTNYIGFLPYDAPKIAFCVRITGIWSSKVAGQASRGATGRLLRYLSRNPKLLKLENVNKQLQWTTAFEDAG
jgi:peptidoglycan glycosyltransferase